MRKLFNKQETLNRRFQEFIIEQLAGLGLGYVLPQFQEKDDNGAMLQKRSGWSCASCDKDLVNLQTRMADFTPWMRLPTPNKVGKGFSKLLQQIKPE